MLRPRAALKAFIKCEQRGQSKSEILYIAITHIQPFYGFSFHIVKINDRIYVLPFYLIKVYFLYHDHF